MSQHSIWIDNFPALTSGRASDRFNPENFSFGVKFISNFRHNAGFLAQGALVNTRCIQNITIIFKFHELRMYVRFRICLLYTRMWTISVAILNCQFVF